MVDCRGGVVTGPVLVPPTLNGALLGAGELTGRGLYLMRSIATLAHERLGAALFLEWYMRRSSDNPRLDYIRSHPTEALRLAERLMLTSR